MNLQARSRPIGIVTSLVFNGIVAITCALNGLTYLDPPPEEIATLIEFDTDEIFQEQQIEVGAGIEPQSENADPTQDVQLVQNSEAPQEGTKPNVSRETTVGTEGDVEINEPERDHEINPRSLFPTANNSDKDTLTTAQVADRVTDALTAGHAQGNTRVGNPEGVPTAQVKGRSVMGSLPFPIEDNIQKSGKVVVQVKVNNQGVVTSAIAGDVGTTVTDRTLWRNAEDAAKKARFNIIESARDTLYTGTITYVFNLK